MAQRPLLSVPRPVLGLLAAALALQLGWSLAHPPSAPPAVALPPAPPLALLQLGSLGESTALAKLSMLYLQSYDDQDGLSLSLRSSELDYGHVEQWLARVLALDPRGQYPLLAASEVYGAVSDPQRVRLMLDFVYRAFDADPDRRWPWLAHAALVAKHRLHDLPLARRYAQALRLRAHGPGVPAWAREMEAFILEDMNELDSAKVLIGGLLSSGQITDPHELQFLSARLAQLAARSNNSPIPSPKNP